MYLVIFIFLICVKDTRSTKGFSRCRGYYNILWTTVLLRQLCKKRLAVLPPPTPPSTPPPPPPRPLLLLLCFCWAAAVLLLSCCFCHIDRGTSSPCSYKINMMLCFAMPTDLSFFRCEICIFFCDLTEFRRFAHRKHIQSDTGMNLAFFKFDRITGWTISLY